MRMSVFEHARHIIIFGISLDPINPNKIVGASVGKPSQEQYRRYFSNREDAREAFLARKQQGLSFSDRVWRYSDLYKHEIELGIDVGLRAGTSADELSRELRSYLKFPDKLFRRVRDERGALVLSKAAKAFHPGQGVYRSSYMNASRLAATETNIAYRTADYERIKDLDFVVGIEVHLSSNHTCKGGEGVFRDICDELQGKNPKDFKFMGWHPHCRCYTTTILKTPAEIAADDERILRGEEPVDGESMNRVDDVPDAFKQWLGDNQERAATSYSVPYFLKDNMQYVPAELREAYASRMPYDTYEEYAKDMRYNRIHAQFSAPIRKNNAALSKVLPVVQGKIMNFTEADAGSGNPDYKLSDATEKGFKHNCQTCTMAYELRRRGFNVEAKANPFFGSTQTVREFDAVLALRKISWEERFLNADGSKAFYSWLSAAQVEDTPVSKRARLAAMRYIAHGNIRLKKREQHMFSSSSEHKTAT